MIVHLIASAPEALTDVLVFDDVGGEWRIAHQRDYDGEVECWIDGSVADSDEMLAEELMLPIFTRVTHWSPLPPKMGDWVLAIAMWLMPMAMTS